MNTNALCPSCGKLVEGDQQKKSDGSCPHCGGSLGLSESITPLSDGGSLLDDDDDEYRLEPATEEVVAPTPATPRPQGTRKAPTRRQPLRCPQCNERLAEGSVLCVACGYHLASGTKLATQRAGSPGGSSQSTHNERDNRNVLGILNRRNSIPLLGLGGFLFGGGLALGLGSLYGEGVKEEMMIYVFVGVVLGAVIGGAIGMVLGPLLPAGKPKSRRSKDGRKIWGFNWTQIGGGGLMFFGGGAVALAAYAAGYIWFFPIGIAITGFIIMINGLMGDSGVW